MNNCPMCGTSLWSTADMIKWAEQQYHYNIKHRYGEPDRWKRIIELLKNPDATGAKP